MFNRFSHLFLPQTVMSKDAPSWVTIFDTKKTWLCEKYCLLKSYSKMTRNIGVKTLILKKNAKL